MDKTQFETASDVIQQSIAEQRGDDNPSRVARNVAYALRRVTPDLWAPPAERDREPSLTESWVCAVILMLVGLLAVARVVWGA